MKGFSFLNVLSGFYSRAGRLSRLEILTISKANIQEILACYAQLIGFKNLEPSPEVNEAFENLVSICLRNLHPEIEEAILSNKDIRRIAPRLQFMCGCGESMLEDHWAQKTLLALPGQVQNQPVTENPLQAAMEVLSDFPYHQNYAELTALEFSLLTENFCNNPFKKVMFIGTGPLPLSSINLMQQLSSYKATRAANPGILDRCRKNRNPSLYLQSLSVDIVNVDHSAEAIRASEKLVRGLGFDTFGPKGNTRGSMEFVCATMPANKQSDFGQAKLKMDVDLGAVLKSCDVVFVAALVGTTNQEKRELLEYLASKMSTSSLIVVRSARGLRGLLYHAVDESIFPSRLKIMHTEHPRGHIVNSVIIARVRNEYGI